MAWRFAGCGQLRTSEQKTYGVLLLQLVLLAVLMLEGSEAIIIKTNAPEYLYRAGNRLGRNCFAPHLHKVASYQLYLNADKWKAARDVFLEHGTVRIRLSVSSLTIVHMNEITWLHEVNVSDINVGESRDLQNGLTMSYVQQDCSKVVRLPFAGASTSSSLASLASSIVSMIPLTVAWDGASNFHFFTCISGQRSGRKNSILKNTSYARFRKHECSACFGSFGMHSQSGS